MSEWSSHNAVAVHVFAIKKNNKQLSVAVIAYPAATMFLCSYV